MREKCALCRELKERKYVVYKDKYCFCIVAKWPIKRGHLLVIPIRHVTDVSDLKKEESGAIFQAIGLLQKILPKIYKIDAIVVQNPMEWRTEGHIHFHILPSIGAVRHLFSKYEGTPFMSEVPDEAMEKIAKVVIKAIESFKEVKKLKTR